MNHSISQWQKCEYNMQPNKKSERKCKKWRTFLITALPPEIKWEKNKTCRALKCLYRQSMTSNSMLIFNFCAILWNYFYFSSRITFHPLFPPPGGVSLYRWILKAESGLGFTGELPAAPPPAGSEPSPGGLFNLMVNICSQEEEVSYAAACRWLQLFIRDN